MAGASGAQGDVKLRSMTGYADGRGASDPWTWSADIRSVNGRGLDLRLRMPDWISGLEPDVRKRLQGAIKRGSVTVNLRVTRADGDAVARLSDAALGAALERIAKVQAAADEIGAQLVPVSAADILSMRGVVDQGEDMVEDTGALKAAILGSLDALLSDFNANRAAEGVALAGVLDDQISQIEALTAKARQVADARVDGARAALERNLARLLDATEVPDEARLLQEMAVIAVKTDVTEEIDRLGGHVEAARALLAEGGAVGRKLDFLMQEFNREANTLCSKAQSQNLTAVGLDLKAVIEQMREQVQNLE